MKILVIEDDAKTAAYLKKGLTEHGFVVDTAGNGEDGLHFATTERYDLVIVDAMLPRRSGWSVVEEIRSTVYHEIAHHMGMEEDEVREAEEQDERSREGEAPDDD